MFWHVGNRKDLPVGFKQIRLRIVLDTDTTADERARLMELTQRYCAVYPDAAARLAGVHDNRGRGKTDAIGERVSG